MKVREIMTRRVDVVRPDASLQEAALKMREVDTGFLPVCDGTTLLGTITDRDITVRATAEGKDPGSVNVQEVMSDKLIYCFEDDDTQEAATLMGQEQVRRLPVLNQQKELVGVVSIGDLAQRSEEEIVGQTIEDITRRT